MEEESRQEILERSVTIKNKWGMHARAAALFRDCASRYKADITVVREHMRANAKSLLGLIALGASKGTVLKIEAKGEDANLALDALEQLVNSMFQEQE
jgi:phosphocarrier protein